MRVQHGLRSRRAGRLLSAWLALGLSACAATPGARRDDALASLIAAERAFAAAAAERGTTEAFLSHLADNAILFRPRPVPGKEYLRTHPASRASLEWDPEYADVAASGSLGYTTGPWILRKQAGGEPLAGGRYLTFWRRPAGGAGGAGGDWKAVIDHGVQGPVDERDVSVSSPVERAVVRGVEAGAAHGGDLTSLLRADSALSASLLKPESASYRDHLASEVRILRDGSKPHRGRDEFESALGEGGIRFYPAAAEVATSGDLGYTYGGYELTSTDGRVGPPRRGTYLRGWRHDPGGRWLLVVDLMTLLPEKG